MDRSTRNKVIAALCVALLPYQTGLAWSNRGHRMVNLVAAESLPPDMPAFLRSPGAIAEISFLGPEPDRWRPEVEPELSNVSGPDHVFRVELGALVSPLPRRRTEFASRLEELRAHGGGHAASLRAEKIGTLPWQAEEVYERLQSAFRSYRIAKGDMKESEWMDEAPIRPEDLPSIEASVRFYAGWLGHYIADGSMPLHDTVNVSGWIAKENPNGYTRNGSIHHRLEVVADDAIERGVLTDRRVLALEPPLHTGDDSFAMTLQYLRDEEQHAEAVYQFEKRGSLEVHGTPELETFLEHRMAEGAAMLRDLIYAAWVQSGNAKAPDLPKTIIFSFPKPSTVTGQ